MVIKYIIRYKNEYNDNLDDVENHKIDASEENFRLHN